MIAVGTGLGLIPLVPSKKKRSDSELSRESKATNERSSGCDSVTNDDSFDEPNNPLIRIRTSPASPVVVIGRSQLLNSFRVACKQHNNNDESEKEENSYQETLQWGKRAISREMLRFSDAGMQIRAKHTTIRNSTAMSSNPQQANHDCSDSHDNSVQKQTLGEAQHGEWGKEPVEINDGDILSFGPSVDRGLLEFRIVRLNKRRRTENDTDISKKPSVKRSTTGSSTGSSVIDLTDDPEQSEKNKVVQSSSSLRKQITFDADSKTRDLDTSNNPTKTNSTEPGKPPFLVHFFPFGNGFSASRRQKLEHNMKSLGATIVDDLWKAKYIVISESIRSLAIVAKRMRVNEERLVEHFQKNADVRCILPSWADHCIASAKTLVIPSRIHAWCYSPPSPDLSAKRKRDEIDSPNENVQDTESRKKVITRVVTAGSVVNTIQTRKKCFPRNAKVAEAFKKLADLHQDMSLIPADSWKSYCFRIVAGRLLELDFEISNDEEIKQRLRSIKGFGKSVCEKIEECIERGTISRIQEFQSDPQRKAMKNLKDIWGVGDVGASDLMDRGYRTIDDVRQGIRQGKLLLERNQLVGVDCYEDILDEMSRSEVEAIGETVRLVAERLFPGIETSIMGSYRRGKNSCGDVDIQLTHSDFVKKIPTDALGRIIDTLWHEGNIAMHLTSLVGMTTGGHYTDYHNASRHVPKDAWKKVKFPSKQTEYKFYMGCFNSPIHPYRRRRVDIKFYPYRERAFATLYFTGNGYFNRSMRLWATRVFGFKLSDQGLFARAGDGKIRVFEATTEREIFDRLKLVYREPHERQYWDALEPIDEDIKPNLKMTEAQWNHDKKSNQWVK